MLPYDLIRDTFPSIVEKWFSRSHQAVLATNVFFSSQAHESSSVNSMFLAAVRKPPNWRYHRSLSDGKYMDQAAYEVAIQQLSTHIPAIIQDDHRQKSQKQAEVR